MCVRACVHLSLSLYIYVYIYIYIYTYIYIYIYGLFIYVLNKVISEGTYEEVTFDQRTERAREGEEE